MGDPMVLGTEPLVSAPKPGCYRRTTARLYLIPVYLSQHLEKKKYSYFHVSYTYLYGRMKSPPSIRFVDGYQLHRYKVFFTKYIGTKLPAILVLVTWYPVCRSETTSTAGKSRSPRLRARKPQGSGFILTYRHSVTRLHDITGLCS